MASLEDIVDRPPLFGSAAHVKLPWNEPGFSQRMLREHLDQTHDLASRRLETIDVHVAWLFGDVLEGRPGSVLDLGCGPGLYAERLAAGGCRCLGIDFSPAAVEYARQRARESGSECTYRLADLRTADVGEGHDLAMMIFGEFNTFARADAEDLLARVQRSLRTGGHVVVEAHRRDFIVGAGTAGPRWSSSRSGLFSPRPHLVLTEHGWDEASATTRTRHLVVDVATGAVTTYGEELAAYTDDEYRDLFRRSGFTDVALRTGMGGIVDDAMVVITARTPDR